MAWQKITRNNPGPEGVLVMTKIDDHEGVRNIQAMKRSGSLWFAGEMYVYYTPTHWRELENHERNK